MATRTDDSLDTTRVAAWRSLVGAQTALSGRVEDALAGAGLPATAWFDVLAALADDEADRRGMRPRDLSCHVGLTKSGLTRLLDRMVEAGLVERRACNLDRRGHFVSLTAAGRRALARAAPAYERVLGESFARRLDPDEVERLRDLLERARPEPVEPACDTDDG